MLACKLKILSGKCDGFALTNCLRKSAQNISYLTVTMIVHSKYSAQLIAIHRISGCNDTIVFCTNYYFCAKTSVLPDTMFSH